MHWYLPQDCLQPTSSDLTYQGHTLWLRAAHDPLVFENVVACVELANTEGKKDQSYTPVEPHAMDCPRGASIRVDPHSTFGRAPFEVQTVDSGWLLEHSSGAPLGYIHAEWEMHCPMRPELDPVLGLSFRLHEILVRPSLKGHGFGALMSEKIVEAMGQHIDLLMAAHGRFRGLAWSVNCYSETVGFEGAHVFARLENRVNTIVREQTQPICKPHNSFALRA